MIGLHLVRISLLLLVVSITIPGCVLPPVPHGHIDVMASPSAATKPGPPPHAKAYGHRAKHRYHYYPDAHVYFDTGRGVYFYLSDGRWSMTASLPTQLKVSLGGHVSLEMEVDRPYVEFEEHKRKYPGKKKHKDKGKGKKKKGKGKYDDD